VYLSRLTIDVGSDATRERPGRLWLRNLYRVHQRLCMAFPSAERKSDDGHFLKPFNPDDFGKGQVHVKRADDSGFLFRIDPGPPGRAVVLVQSAVQPDWEYAFHNAGYLLAACPETKPFDSSFKAGQHLRFRLVANPTKKIDTIRQEDRQRYTKEELSQIEGRNGRRVPVPSSEELSAWRQRNPNGDERTFISLRLLEWIERKAEPAGFSLENVAVQPGYLYVHKGGNAGGQRLRSARYDGALVVTDPEKFRGTLRQGVGPGKAYGFGLLSVTPCPAPRSAEAA